MTSKSDLKNDLAATIAAAILILLTLLVRAHPCADDHTPDDRAQTAPGSSSDGAPG